MKQQIKVGDKVRRLELFRDSYWGKEMAKVELKPESSLTVESFSGRGVSFTNLKGSGWCIECFELIPTVKKKTTVVRAKKPPFKVGDCILCQNLTNKMFDSFTVLAVSDNYQAVAYHKCSDGDKFLWKNLKEHNRFIQVVK